jgi:hypothetical protein
MRKLLPVLLALCALPAFAADPAPYKGPDYSGTYDCTGEDGHDGAYKSTVTLKLVREQSFGKYAAYDFEMKVPGYGTYPGHGAAQGDSGAIYFANTDQANKDYGTGIVKFAKAKSGKWEFTKFYYEPEYKGGNRGTEICVQQ